jgi:colicin import membrane protein
MSTDLATEKVTLPEGYPFHIGTRIRHTVDDHGKYQAEYIPLTLEDFIHPLEEDKFMIGIAHQELIWIIRNEVTIRFIDDPDMYIMNEVRIDWQHPTIRAHGPDLIVFRGYAPYRGVDAGTVMVRDWKLKPQVIIEVTSPETRTADFEQKYLHYEALEIPYYLILDTAGPPDADVKILGFRWRRGGFQPLRLDPEFGIWVPPLDMYIQYTEDGLALWDRERQLIPPPEQAAFVIREARQEAETQRLRAETEKQRAEDAQQRAEAEQQRAETEKQRADELARELAELRARLDGAK